MDSSSSSNSQQGWKYHVFLSFRGDTRNNFTSHLYAALRRRGIYTFKDDEELPKGETIAPKLKEAINESLISIVVFSKEYADSRWCLEELAIIAECVEQRRRGVLPVFYDVDPSDVRKQSGEYQNAFDGHEIRFQEDSPKVQRWRDAMTKVGNVVGYDVRGKDQAEEVEKIVEEVISILGDELFSLTDDLIGMDNRAEEFEKVLNLESKEDVRVIGICGMAGTGKTTLATVAYLRYSQEFNARSVVLDMGNFSGGLIDVQKQLLSDMGIKQEIKNLLQGTKFMRSVLRHLKVFIVLDNVVNSEQLERLPRKSDLGAGSRVIITTRDKRVLTAEHEVDEVYDMSLLNEEESLQLFCRKAFKDDNIKRGYEELTRDMLEYAQDLPLATRVLGSLCLGREVPECRDILSRLRKYPDNQIINVLRTSYDLLEKTNKEIFLDIACFYNGMHCEFVEKILNYLDRYPRIGIKELQEKSLITIFAKKIRMHGTLQAMGRKIAREGKLSRLWDSEDLRQKKEMEDVEAIVLTRRFPEENYRLEFPIEDLEDEEDMQIQLRAQLLSEMRNLVLLILHNVNVSGSLSRLSNELKYLYWHKYPFTSLPSSFQPGRLIELNMPGSSIERLWKGKKSLPNLTRINLCFSKNLIETPDFSELPNLEQILLRGCTKLRRIHPSIGLLKKVRFLDFSDCKNLEKAMHFECSKTLDILPSLTVLDLSFCGLCEIPDVIGQLISLKRLDLSGNNFVRLPSSIKNLSKLGYLDLIDCQELQSLPELATPALPIRRDFPPVGEQVHPLEGVSGLWMFNCPKLARIDGSISMAFSWILRVLQEPHARRDFISVCIPGSQIPSWFGHQTLGSDGSMLQCPPPDVDDKNFIGAAFCMTSAVQNCMTSAVQIPSMFPHLTKTRKFGSSLHFMVENVRQSFFLAGERPTVGSDHLWLIYFPRESSYTRRIIRSFSCDLSGDGLVTKNCACRWVFKQDLEDLYTLTHDGK